MLDIGSHTGYWTRHFLKYFNCECHMFEPQNHLHKHCSDITSLDNVHIHGLALVKRLKIRLLLMLKEPIVVLLAALRRNQFKRFQTEKLKVITLNDFLDQNNYQNQILLRSMQKDWTSLYFEEHLQ